MHTVYSDGEVLPTTRVEEAWRNGLDVISITDHIESFYGQSDIQKTLDKLYSPARAKAGELYLTFISGTELTLSMPPGHLSAIFLKDTGALRNTNWREAVKAAHEQGAFIAWCHPGWTGQQPDGTAKWYQEHTEMLEKGWLQGIEIVNNESYYPEAHKWCMEHGLTMLGNSDAHEPICMVYEPASAALRPLTLVFAKENSEEAVKDALLSRRTAVLWNNTLIGDEKYLRPIFEKSIHILNPYVSVKGGSSAGIQIRNESDIGYKLIAVKQNEILSVPRFVELAAGKTAILEVMAGNTVSPGEKNIVVTFAVKNLMISPVEGLPVELNLTVNITGTE